MGRGSIYFGVTFQPHILMDHNSSNIGIRHNNWTIGQIHLDNKIIRHSGNPFLAACVRHGGKITWKLTDLWILNTKYKILEYKNIRIHFSAASKQGSERSIVVENICLLADHTWSNLCEYLQKYDLLFIYYFFYNYSSFIGRPHLV